MQAASHFSYSFITKFTWWRRREQFLSSLDVPGTKDTISLPLQIIWKDRKHRTKKRDHGNPLVKNLTFLCFELWKSCSFNFILLWEELIRLELWLCSKEMCVVFLFSSVFNLKLLNFTCSLNSEDREKFNISVFICVEEHLCTEMNKRSHPTQPESQMYDSCCFSCETAIF